MQDLKRYEDRVVDMKALYQRMGITKKVWLDKTGFTENQWNCWRSGKSAPHVSQVAHMLTSLDINPLHIWFGLGPERLSELEQQLDLADSVYKAISQIDEIHAKVV